MTPKQLETNRQNALRSTGPRSAYGKSWSRKNAIKHGILSRQVVVRSRHCPEKPDEFRILHRQFSDQLLPVGPVEEMLVEQIVTCRWRLRRAWVAESGEITLSKDREHEEQARPPDMKFLLATWRMSTDPFREMIASAVGVTLLANWLRDLRDKASVSGEITEADIRKFLIASDALPNRLTIALERLREQLLQNPDTLDPEALRHRNREMIGQTLDQEASRLENLKHDREARDATEYDARQSAAMVPSAPVLDRILRYETNLERQLHRAMIRLERLQRMRLGEAVPPPVCVEITEKA